MRFQTVTADNDIDLPLWKSGDLFLIINKVILPDNSLYNAESLMCDIKTHINAHVFLHSSVYISYFSPRRVLLLVCYHVGLLGSHHAPVPAVQPEAFYFCLVGATNLNIIVQT